MSIEMRLENNHAVQLLMAITRLFHDEDVQKHYKTVGLVEPSYVTQWLEQTKKRISPFLNQELKLLFVDAIQLSLELFYILIESGIKTPEELLQTLDQFSADEFRSRICDYFSLTQKEYADDALLAALYEARPQGESLEKLVPVLSRILTRPEDVLSHYQKAIREFYQIHFTEIKEQLYLDFKQNFPVYLLATKDRADEFQNALTLGNGLKMFKGARLVRCIPTRMLPSVYLISVPQRIIFFGVHTFSELEKKDKKQEIDQFFKLMADPTRIEILRALRLKKMYGKELAEKLHISPATVSHHLKELGACQLLQFESGERKRLYFSINYKRIKELLDHVHEDLIPEDGSGERYS